MGPTNIKRQTDVLVIGSGAGGACVAFKLARQGVNVTMLEKGDWITRDEKTEDELNQIHQEMYRPSGEIDPTVVRSDGQLVAESSRVGQSFYMVGGGTIRYAATSWRFRKEDFKKLSTYGPQDGSTLVDWPISYEDLEPYYTEAENEIGISGVAGSDPTEPPRSKDVLLPPLAEDRFQRLITKAAKNLGWRPFPLPVAIHSKISEKTGGQSCMQCGWCSGFPCLFRAKSSVDVVLYPRLKKNRHFTLKTHAYALKILSDKKKKVTGVEYLNLKTGKKETLGCRTLVLALSAIQTARLLLLSDLANSSTQVGKNLMFHIEAKASALFEEEYNQGLYKKVGITDFYFPKKEQGFVNHISLQSGSKAPPIAFALSQPGFGKDYIAKLQERFLHQQEFQCMIEDLPQVKNFVSLSTARKDPWGVPAPEIHHFYHPQDRMAAEFALGKVKSLLSEAGGSNIEIPKVHSSIVGRYTWHLMGTTRMGTDPKTSVVNPDCRTHDVSNLYIADGSPFCTSAGLNPTLTIQALALRTADRILAARKKGAS